MTYCAGLDASVESTSISVIDEASSIHREFSAPSHPDNLAIVLGPLASNIGGIALQVNTISAFLADGLKRKGLDSVFMATRRVHAALSAIPIMTDRQDTRGIAELLRMGWFQPVQLKTPTARDLRSMLSARDSQGRRVREFDNSVLSLLRGFGLRIPTGVRGRLCDLVRDLIVGNPVLETAVFLLLSARDAMAEEFAELDKQVRDQSCNDEACRRLMAIPGVNAIVAVTFRSVIDDPKRFRWFKSVGARFGLTPRRYQSGETDRVTSFTKASDASVRAALNKAANVMLVKTTR